MIGNYNPFYVPPPPHVHRFWYYNIRDNAMMCECGEARTIMVKR